MELPLFPLSAVLFPGGVLPLRIFETRYMDMARDCLRDGSLFGVCLITDPRASDVSRTTATAPTGCMASITAWDMKQLGLLHVRAVGRERFNIIASNSRADGLRVAEIEMIEADSDDVVLPEHTPCVELLRRIIDDLSAQAAERRREGEADDVLSRLPFEEPFRLDSSSWVSNRLCEVLPVPLKAKQKLMELGDGRTRLEIVRKYLKQHAVLK
jgi:Lon protease-like protein